MKKKKKEFSDETKNKFSFLLKFHLLHPEKTFVSVDALVKHSVKPGNLTNF